MPPKMQSTTEKEMSTTFAVIEAVKYKQIQTMAALYISGPIISIGFGSSCHMPGQQLVHRARQLNPHLDVRAGTTYEHPPHSIPEDALVLLHSNSGETGAILELAKKLLEREIQTIGITAQHDSTLTELLPTIYLHSSAFEKATSATYSVYESTLFNDAFIHAITHRHFPLKHTPTLEALVETMRNNFGRPIDQITINTLVNAGHVYFMGIHNGLGAEVALKAEEIAGKRSTYHPGEALMHGYFEGMQQGDVIIVFEPETLPQFHPTVLDKLKSKAAAKQVTLIGVGEEQTFDRHIQAAVMRNFEAYSLLPRMWRLLIDIGEKTKGNVDTNSEATAKYVR